MKKLLVMLMVFAAMVGMVGCKTLPPPEVKKTQDLKITQNEISNVAQEWQLTNTSIFNLVNDTQQLNDQAPSSPAKEKINTNLVKVGMLLSQDEKNINKLHKQSVLLNHPINIISEQSKKIQKLEGDRLSKMNAMWIFMGIIGIIIVAAGVACWWFYDKKVAISALGTGICLVSLSYFFIAYSVVCMIIGACIVGLLIFYMAKNPPKFSSNKNSSPKS